MRKSIVVKSLLYLAIFIFLNYWTNHSVLAATETQTVDDLYSEIGDALINVKSENWEAIEKNMDAFDQTWQTIKVQVDHRLEEKAITNKLLAFKKSLNNKDRNKGEIEPLLTDLSKAVVAYDKILHPVDHEQEKQKLAVLLPMIDQVEANVQAGELTLAFESYKKLNTKWTTIEPVVRTQSIVAYGQIETYLAFMRIGLSQDPADEKKVLDNSLALKGIINDFLNGKLKSQNGSETYTLKDVTQLLDTSLAEMKAGEKDKAIKNLNQALIIWPVVEGEVRTRDTSLYNKIENDIPATIGLLSSKNVDMKKAKSLITNINAQLELITTKTTYTFVDALLILLREGMEAILIVTGLIAFLKKTNNPNGKKWIWGGALAGFIASAVLAICINIFFSNIAAATNREALEGVIGLIAVVMMLTVGAWLHQKTNLLQWNTYMEKSIGKALATGSLFSMATLSFLAIFREGAETIIFYIGMSPSIKVSQLALGIGLAVILLVILGVVIIRYSSVIPLRPFFIVATWVIYILTFKMIGVSMHALQIAKILPTHFVQDMPFIQWIGLYPTVETIVPQLILLMIIVGTSFYVKNPLRRKKRTVTS